MVTDIRRAAVQGVRDNSGPVTFAFGLVLVAIGIAEFLAVGRGELLGLFEVTMPFGVLHLGLGAALVSAAILGPRPARVTATWAGLTFLALGVAGLAGVTRVAPNGADIALCLVLGMALTAVGRR
ncbi:DUF4383 domain-containing protein [Actinoplanes sp. NPDC004185]